MGVYVGNGQGEDEATTCVTDGPMEDDLPDVEHGYQYPETTNNECGIDHTKSLTIIYDCETTGLNVYREHITEIAAKVVNPPVPLSNPCFSSLVRSGRNISVSGKNYLLIITKLKIIYAIIVSRLNGITTALLRREKPLSAVLPNFLEWVATAVRSVNQATHEVHYPGTIY